MTRLHVLALLVVALVLTSARGAARASPLVRSDEELLVDGDIDPEDLVARGTVGRAVLPRAPGGEAWLSLAGFTQETPSGGREVGGYVVVGLPFDRIARLGTRAASPGLPMAAAAGANVVVTSPVEDIAVGVTPRLARAAVESAWRAAGLGSDDARLDGIVARARWSALLPETRLRATRLDDQRLYTETTSDVNRLRDSAGANLGLEARLTWRFDRLLYADDEPSFERMRLERHDARSRVAARVLEALFHWHRAWLELRYAQAASREAHEPPNRPSRDELEAALRVMEAEATLDVLTAGWFTGSSMSALARARVLVSGGANGPNGARGLPAGPPAPSSAQGL
jgi:hypothetical protein